MKSTKKYQKTNNSAAFHLPLDPSLVQRISLNLVTSRPKNLAELTAICVELLDHEISANLCCKICGKQFGAWSELGPYRGAIFEHRHCVLKKAFVARHLPKGCLVSLEMEAKSWIRSNNLRYYALR